MKKISFIVLTMALATASAFAQNKLVTKTGHAVIFSHTVAEDITANNYDVAGVIDPSVYELGISLPVQSFQFEKALMQEHFNSAMFLDSKQYPRIIFKGTWDKSANISFTKNGKYEADITGVLTIKGISNPLSAKATIQVENGKVSVNTSFVVTNIGGYGVGKPRGSKKNNVADDIQVTYTATYEAGE